MYKPYIMPDMKLCSVEVSVYDKDYQYITVLAHEHGSNFANIIHAAINLLSYAYPVGPAGDKTDIASYARNSAVKIKKDLSKLGG